MSEIWTQITSGDGYGHVLVKQGNEYVEPAAAYPAGTVLTIKAAPGEGANFSRWIGEGNPVLTCPDSYGNGRVVVEGAASLTTPMQWHEKTSGDKFFRTVLKP